MRTLFAYLFSIASIFAVQGQETFQPRPLNKSETVGYIFDKEVSTDLRLHTNGFALALNFGKLKTYYKTTFYQFEIGEIRHPKEHRNQFDAGGINPRGSGASYIYGKRNNLYAFRIGYGTKRYFSEKAKKKGIAVGASYVFGPSLGLLKPYHLVLQYPGSTPDESDVKITEPYTEENREIFLDPSYITGSAGFTKGFSGLKIRPGVHAKAAMHFALGAFDEVVKSFEAGVMFDWYFTEVPIMVPLENNENKSYFFNLYLNLQFGKRW